MDVGGLAISLAFSVGACAGGGWWCLKRLAEARFLLDTPTSKVRSAAQGYVELYGVLQELPDTPIAAPLTGTPCLWWRFKIEEYSESGKKRSWRVVESGSSEGWLRFDDGTGECLINPLGAEVRPATKQVWRGNLRHPRLQEGATGMLGWLLSGGSEYRYTEERLHAGEPLYAIGDFRTAGGAQAVDLTVAQGVVVREWKGDFAGLLQRFDSNADGQLDEGEWARMRESARVEAQRRQRQQNDQPPRNQLQQPPESQPFILSSQGEDVLARGFYWQAAGGAALCLLGALATTWLVTNVLLPELVI